MRRKSSRVIFSAYRNLWLLVGIVLVSCTDARDAPVLPSQTWEGVKLSVETRPLVPVPGMNEFLVIANEKSRKPATDMIVSIRMGEGDPWRQAIQDGHVGVYRRALLVGNEAQPVLYMYLKRGGKEGMLRFPLQMKANSK